MKNHKIKTNIFYERKWRKDFQIIDYLDQNNLINQIYKLKPKTVLEIGSGIQHTIIHALLNLKIVLIISLNFTVLIKLKNILQSLRVKCQKYIKKILFLFIEKYM